LLAVPVGIRWGVLDSFQAQLAANRAQFHYDLPAGPFYGYNRSSAKPSQRISASASSRTTGAATAVQVRAGAATTWPPVSTRRSGVDQPIRRNADRRLLEGCGSPSWVICLSASRPHVLRHGFAGLAADLGFNEPTIASLLGGVTSR
jgi:hypothetical protein